MYTTRTARAVPLVPASFFGIVLGLAGLAGDWRAAHLVWQLPPAVGEALYACALAAWLVVATLYALKWRFAPAVAREETGHPVQCCFIGLGGVSTMLLAQGALPYSRTLAIVLFVPGVLFTAGFALWRTGRLWRGGRDPATSTPVMYLPLVAGGFVAGTVAAALGWRDWAQLAFGAGFFSWLAVESVLLHRLYTAPAMPPALRPTLGIQLAPPAVGAMSYVAVGGAQADLLAHMLVGYALLQALLVLRMQRWIREQPFGPSYWAFTFGAAALAGAVLRLSAQAPGGALATLAPVLFVCANALVLVIAAGTVRLLLQGRLLAPAAAAGAGTKAG